MQNLLTVCSNAYSIVTCPLLIQYIAFQCSIIWNQLAFFMMSSNVNIFSAHSIPFCVHCIYTYIEVVIDILNSYIQAVI